MKPNLIILPQLLPVMCNVVYIVVYITARLAERTQHTLVYNIRISQGSVATRLKGVVEILTAFDRVFSADCASKRLRLRSATRGDLVISPTITHLWCPVICRRRTQSLESASGRHSCD